MEEIKTKKHKTGFTLVETMFAVFILTSTIVGLMTVVSNSLFAARYARDEITVNYLLQEAIDYIRNDRDTSVFLSSGGSWDNFLIKYSGCSNQETGCYLDVLNNNSNYIPEECSFISGCPYMYYDSSANTTSFYVTGVGAATYGKTATSFQRKVLVQQNVLNPDEIDVTAIVYWKNGSLPMARVLKTSLLKWQ